MSEPAPLNSEKLVEVHKAREEWEGNLLIDYLRKNGVSAAFQGESAINLDLAHFLKNTDEAFGVYVLEEDASKARELVKEFFAARPEDAV